MRDRMSWGGAGLLAFLGALVVLTLSGLVLASALLATRARADAAAAPGPGSEAGEPPPAVAGREPVPVPALDLGRFAGTWYVVATIPDPFHEGCAAEPTITYTLQPDRHLRVQNRCRGADDSLHLDDGVVRVQQPGTLTSRLEVRYAPDWLAWMPLAWSKVWIIGLGDGYGHALAGTPDRAHLWVLSRSPVLAEAEYAEMVGIARDQGYDITAIRRVPQEGGSAESVEEGAPLPAP